MCIYVSKRVLCIHTHTHCKGVVKEFEEQTKRPLLQRTCSRPVWSTGENNANCSFQTIHYPLHTSRDYNVQTSVQTNFCVSTDWEQIASIVHTGGALRYSVALGTHSHAVFTYTHRDKNEYHGLLWVVWPWNFHTTFHTCNYVGGRVRYKRSKIP